MTLSIDLVLLIAAVILGVVAIVQSDARWAGAGVICIAAALLI